MLSFKSIAVFATLAFGAISSLAAPAPILDDNTIVTNAIVKRCGCKSVPTIIADVHAAVAVHVDAIGE